MLSATSGADDIAHRLSPSAVRALRSISSGSIRLCGPGPNFGHILWIVGEHCLGGSFARRLQDIESDTGYDTRRRVLDGVFAGVSQTAVYDTC